MIKYVKFSRVVTVIAPLLSSCEEIKADSRTCRNFRLRNE